jgi:protoporphyrinogen oxidase
MNVETIIIGAGITGLSAGLELQEKAMIFEKESVPGGLARSKNFGGYWFDKSVHFLMLNDENIHSKLMPLFGKYLKHFPLVVWVNTSEGIVRYPFQLNIGGLNKLAKAQCLDDFKEVYYLENKDKSNYKTFLENTFGKKMCELFFIPYNEKCWKFPLDKIVAPGQIWNIQQPTMSEVIEGYTSPNITRGRFNTNGFYPRPEKGYPVRGIGLITKILAENVSNLNLVSEVIKIDPMNRLVFVNHLGFINAYKYKNCLSTIPLPRLMEVCMDVPHLLMRKVKKLRWTTMLSLAFAIKGERLKNTGHYHYYADPKIPFNKLVFTTEFDPYGSPDDGYGLLVEYKHPNDTPYNESEILKSIEKSLVEVGAIKDIKQIVAKYIWEIDPAYVIFTKETKNTVGSCHDFLNLYGITSLGRYGNWEYSSMMENIKDGFAYAKRLML